ncbi:hypothetical protein PE067_19980 [Paracoccus sp. DMF-8]|uniref:hypothetical protein n=1 Tax=Paracoccus sp. DMF-8 TaxID=3019445 RepID=UPI0023E45DD2|nr:hypothetical protein [Paracoccus sp. DMF-8]MDF3608220.1 hypothetical protein [Paracoccus sp. DMF-8]
MDIQIGQMPAQLAHQHRQAAVKGRGDKADGQHRVAVQPDAAGRLFHLIDAPQHLQRLFIEQPPRIGQPDRAGLALDQGDAQLLLQQLDLAAQRRLCDVQDLCRAGKVPLARDGGEIAQLSQIHPDSRLARPK